MRCEFKKKRSVEAIEGHFHLFTFLVLTACLLSRLLCKRLLQARKQTSKMTRYPLLKHAEIKFISVKH